MVRTISESAFRILSQSRSFRILSVHKNLINLDTDRGLFTIQTAQTPRTPFAIVVEDTFFYSLKHHLESDPFTSYEEYKSKILLSFDPSSIYSSRLSSKSMLTMLEIEDLAQGISEVLQLEQQSDGLKDFSTTITFLNSGLQILSSDDSILGTFVCSKLQGATYTELPSLITSMIGLGNGLTPSMDDFIVGLISALNYLDASLRLKIHKEMLELTENRRDATNRVSESFLQSAVKGEFAQPVLDLYDAVSSKNRPPLETALHRMLHIGHTSGADSLNGILFGIKLYHKLFFQ